MDAPTVLSVVNDSGAINTTLDTGQQEINANNFQGKKGKRCDKETQTELFKPSYPSNVGHELRACGT